MSVRAAKPNNFSMANNNINVTKDKYTDDLKQKVLNPTVPLIQIQFDVITIIQILG